MSPARRAVVGLAGAAALIGVITVASRALGFGRWLAQSWAVGQTATGTAYATANLVPNVLFEVVAGGALAGAVVPLLAGPLARARREEVDRIASALLTWAVLVLTPASVLLAVLARPAVALLLPADAASQDAVQDLATTMLLIFAPQVVLYGIGVVLTGVLQAQRRFAWPAAAPLASSVVVIATYVVFRSLAVQAVQDPEALPPSAVAWLAWGTTAGVAALSLPLLVPVVRSGVRLRPTLRFPPGVARRARALAVSGLAALLAQQLALVVAVRLANGRGELEGTVNLFQYTQAVYLLPYAVLAVPLATAVFPRVAELAATARDHVADLVSVTSRAVLLVSVAGAAGLGAAAPAVTEVFSALDASGDPAGVSAMTPALTLMVPGLLGYGLLLHLSRVLLALDRPRVSALGVATGWGAVAVASVVAVLALAPRGGDEPATLAGLAVGTSVGMLVGAVVLAVGTRRAAGGEAVRGLLRTLVVTGVPGLLGAWVGRLAADRILGTAGSAGADAAVAPVGVSILAATAAGLLAVGVVAAAAILLDRGTVRALRGSGAPVAQRSAPEPVEGERT